MRTLGKNHASHDGGYEGWRIGREGAISDRSRAPHSRPGLLFVDFVAGRGVPLAMSAIRKGGLRRALARKLADWRWFSMQPGRRRGWAPL